MNTKRKAFTLVELLIVISIIGILTAMILPGIGSAMTHAKKSTSKVFLQGIAAALEQYQVEYGGYPAFLTAEDRINLNDDVNAERLIKMLTGKNADGTHLPSADRIEFNRKASEFISFKEANLLKKKAVGENPAMYKVIDSFANPNIYIAVSKDNHMIKAGYPTKEDGIPARTLQELIPNDSGLTAKVILYTLKKDEAKTDGTYTCEDVFSWQ